MTSRRAVEEGIRREAERLGANPREVEHLVRTARVESNFNLHAKNPYSSAAGPFQFIRSTGAMYGLGQHNISDLAAQTEAALAFTRDNAAALEGVLGSEKPTSGDLYLAHFLGVGGARNVIRANPNQLAKDIVGLAVVNANASISFNGKSFAQFTAQDLRDWANAKMEVYNDAKGYVDAQKRGDLASGSEYARRILKKRGMPDPMIDMLMALQKQDPFGALILQLIIETVLNAPGMMKAADPTVSPSTTLMAGGAHFDPGALGGFPSPSSPMAAVPDIPVKLIG